MYYKSWLSLLLFDVCLLFSSYLFHHSNIIVILLCVLWHGDRTLLIIILYTYIEVWVYIVNCPWHTVMSTTPIIFLFLQSNWFILLFSRLVFIYFICSSSSISLCTFFLFVFLHRVILIIIVIMIVFFLHCQWSCCISSIGSSHSSKINSIVDINRFL